MKIVLYSIVALCLISCSTNSNKNSITENTLFPDTWNGHYKGDLILHKNGIANDTTTMELKIYRIDMNKTAFHIKYDTSNWRDYEITEGKANNHWIMDEKNSVLIDHYLNDQTLSSLFSVKDKKNAENKSILHASYSKVGENIISNIATYPMNYGSITGDSLDWEVTSYRERLVQKCVLKPVRN